MKRITMVTIVLLLLIIKTTNIPLIKSPSKQ